MSELWTKVQAEIDSIKEQDPNITDVVINYQLKVREWGDDKNVYYLNITQQ